MTALRLLRLAATSLAFLIISFGAIWVAEQLVLQHLSWIG